MPLPKKKLKRTASKKAKSKRMQTVMHDLKNGPHHKDRTHKQEVAIAMESAGEGKNLKRVPKRNLRRKTKRTKKRMAPRR